MAIVDGFSDLQVASSGSACGSWQAPLSCDMHRPMLSGTYNLHRGVKFMHLVRKALHGRRSQAFRRELAAERTRSA